VKRLTPADGADTSAKYVIKLWNRAKFLNDFSRARACGCAQGSGQSDSASRGLSVADIPTWYFEAGTFAVEIASRAPQAAA